MKNQLPLFLIFFILCFSCKEDNKEEKCFEIDNPECENYDPCFDKDSVRADFVIQQFTGYGTQPDSIQWITEDSIFTANQIRFRSTVENAEYTWYLGSEKLQDQQFVRTFKDVAYGTTIGVSLVVEKTPQNLDCFPNDDGRDSVYREFTIKTVCELLVHNKFKGTFERFPQDTVILELTAINPETGECEGPWRGINFNGKVEPKDTSQIPNFNFSYSKYYFTGSGSASVDGYLFVDPKTHKVEMEYRYYSVDRKFTGKIIP